MSVQQISSRLGPTSTLRSVRDIAKSQKQLFCSGFLAEDLVFEMLAAQGIAYIRAPEAGSTDGVFLWNPDPESTPDASSPPDVAWAWAKGVAESPKPKKIRFLPFDVKYLSLMPGGLKGLEYAYLNPPRSHYTEHAEVYLVSFESAPDYVAFVPKLSLDQSTDFAYGIQPLISGLPCWAIKFMVRWDQVPEAVDRLLATREGHWYVNPSTCVRLEDWLPRQLLFCPIWPAEERMAVSLGQMMELYRLFREAGAKVAANPLQPLWCDFLLELCADEEAVRVEHKWMKHKGFPEPGKRSPFAPGRQWHFLIFQHGDGGFVCFARHHVKASWSAKNPPRSDLLPFTYSSGPREFSRMLDYMRRERHQAMRQVDDIIAHPTPDAGELEVMLTSGFLGLETLLDFTVDQLQTAVGRSHHDRSLHWLCHQLNHRFALARSMLCFALDIGHPLGTHVVVRYVWTLDEQSAFLSESKLPRAPYSPELADERAAVLRFADLSAAAKASHTFPIYMRQAYWTQLVSKLHFVLIGGTYKGSMMESSSLADSYLCLPSTFLSLHKHPLRPSIQCDKDEQGYRARAGLIFRKDVFLEDDALPSPTFKSKATEVKAIAQGSGFMEDSTVNPLRYIVDLDTIHRALQDLINGDPEGEMSIHNPQSGKAGKPFSRRPLHTRLCDVHHAGWTHGYTRKHASRGGPARAGSDDE